MDQGAEDQLRLARGPAPEHDVELVLQKAGQRSLGGVADELAEFRLGGSHFGDVVRVRRRLLLRRNVAACWVSLVYLPRLPGLEAVFAACACAAFPSFSSDGGRFKFPLGLCQ